MEIAPQLTAAERNKIRRLSAPKELAPDEEGGELNIVPFLDIITNVLMFVLATVAVTFTATVDSTPPSIGSKGVRSQTDTKSLNLSVFVVNDGFSLKTSGGNIATGCLTPGAGLAVPKAGAEYDYAGLRECATRLKDASADFEEETQFTLTANPGTDYQTVIRTIDALRWGKPKPGEAEEKRKLFPDVHFGAPR